MSLPIKQYSFLLKQHCVSLLFRYYSSLLLPIYPGICAPFTIRQKLQSGSQKLTVCFKNLLARERILDF